MTELKSDIYSLTTRLEMYFINTNNSLINKNVLI